MVWIYPKILTEISVRELTLRGVLVLVNISIAEGVVGGPVDGCA